MNDTDKPVHIAIDGPAASGKTTVGKIVARHLKALFFDTGLVYRAATWHLLNNSNMTDDPQQIMAQLKTMKLTLQTNPVTLSTDIYINGKQIGDELHQPIIDKNVSVIAAIPEVRAFLTGMQREIGLNGRTVLVGRDIGTVVLPEANPKIYLIASAEKRAERRFLENRKRDINADYQEILNDIRRRDQIDSSRQTAPLKAAEDAYLIDTDCMTAEEVAEEILKHAAS